MTEPCWEIDRGPWECPHFPSREEAEEERARYLAEYEDEDGPIRQLPVQCDVRPDDEYGEVHEPRIPAATAGLDEYDAWLAQGCRP